MMRFKCAQQAVAIRKATSHRTHWARTTQWLLWAASLLAIAPSGLLAQASQNIVIFGTGVNTPGNLLADGAVDSHYTLYSSADSGFPGPNAIVVNSTAWPIPPWLADGPASKWIAPQRDQTGGNAAGNYTYRTTFNLANLNWSTAVLTGQYASDNTATMLLNGTPVGPTSTCLCSFTPFTIASGFQAGLNTLDFVVNNAGSSANPTGLRVDISGTATPLTTLTVFGTGVNTPGSLLADGSVDPHYVLRISADPGFPGPNAIVVNSTAWPIPPWIAEGPNSKWIAPQRDQTGGNAAGNYTYRTTVDLTNLSPSSVVLTGQIASDNSATMLLNGAPVGPSGTTLNAFTAFTIASGFQAGVNTLDFVVNNAGTSASPTGLRVDLNGTVSGFGFSPASASYLGGGGVDHITISASAGVSWSATSNSSWIAITSGGSGSGNGTVNYSVDINSTGAARSGSVTLNGQTFSVTQSALVAGGPSNVSMTPSSTPSPNPGPVTFTFTASDPNGYAYIDWVQVLYNWNVDGTHACYIFYDRRSNSIYLMNDTSNAWFGPVALGTPGQVLQNSQCSLDVGASQASGSATNLNVSVALTIKPQFLGPQKIFALVGDHAGNQIGWLQPGTWTGYAASSQLPTGSVVPNIGTGMSATLAFHSNDVNGWGYIPQEQILVNSGQDATHACYFLYFPGPNGLYLLNDAGNTWAGPIHPGSSGTLSNGQCSLDASQSSFANASSTDLTLNLPVAFTAAFQGQKNIYTIVYDHAFQTAGFTTAGTWTVGASAAAVAAPTFNPGPGTYTSAQTVAISTTTTGASIRYTLDGSTPSSTAGILYNGPFVVSRTTTVTAIAYSSGMTNSTILAGSYTINITSLTMSPPVVTLSANMAQQFTASLPGSSNPAVTWSLGLSSVPPGANPGSIGADGVYTAPSSIPSQFGVNIYASAVSGSATGAAIVTLMPPVVTINTAALLPNGNAGTAYTQTLSATGGTSPYSWSATAGVLPGGMSLSSGGVLNGVPAGAGTYLFTVLVTDSASHTASKSFSLTVKPQLFITSPTTLPSGTYLVAYNSQTLTAVGGTPPYLWQVISGGFPLGLSFGTNGTIGGTPYGVNGYIFTVRVSDSAGQNTTQTFGLTIAPPQTQLTVATNATLPGGTVGVGYSQTLIATGGTAPYNWTVTSGTLPAGLSLLSSGLLSGAPVSGGTSSFNVQVTDSVNNIASRSFSLTVSTGVTISTNSPLPSGAVGTPYSQTLSAAGGAAPYSWSLLSGTLPSGVTLSGGGVLSGTPGAAGSYNFTVQVVDGNSRVATKSFNLFIPAVGLAVNTSSPLTAGTVGSVYAQSLYATGGTPPYSWSISSGFLPPGMTLTSSGVLSGTPGAVGVYGFNVLVVDNGGHSAGKGFNLMIGASLAAAKMIAPAAGTVLGGASATFTWDAGTGVSQYQLLVGSIAGASDLYAITGTAQSAAVNLPATGQGAVFVTLRSLISGAWQARSYTYLRQPVQLSSRSADVSEENFVYNDNRPLGGYIHSIYLVSNCCSYPGIGAAVQFCVVDDPAITVTPSAVDDGFQQDYEVTFQAGPSARTGHHDVYCYYDDFSVSGYYQLVNAMQVYDAQPVITSIERYDAPGSATFVQGEGQVGVRIRGRNFGLNPLNDKSRLTVSGSDVTVDSVTGWQDSGTEIDAVFNISPSALGPYTVTVTSMGASGLGFQRRPKDPPSNNNGSGQINVSPAPTVRLIQFGWGNNQELWKATTFGSNGDSQIGPIVWSDPNGDGNVTINEPAALQAGSDTPYLSNIVLRTDPAVSAIAELQVVVVQNGFVFPSLAFEFANGQATISNLNLGGPIPSLISNATYDFQWKIRFSSSSAFQTFKTTTHRLYLIHGLVTIDPAAYRITTKRLDYVTGLATGQSDLPSIVSRLADGLQTNPGLDAGFHIATPDNVWAALDGLLPGQDGLDCESVSAIAAAQLQQLGYASANVRLAYPTGAIPSGDTDATTQEWQSVNNLIYSLSFFNGNYFEGFVYLSSPADTNQPTAFTVFPKSNGALGFTGCTVSPSSNDYLIAFRILTSTYRLLGVGYQEWYWDKNRNTGGPPSPPNFGQIPLPANNCPASEYP